MPQLSVIVPCYNESNTIERLLLSLDGLKIDKEVIVVDDASDDGTRAILDRLKQHISQLVIHDKHRGKGAALRSAFLLVRGDVVIIHEADLEYDMRDYPALFQPVVECKADAVYGSRFIGANTRRIPYFWLQIGRRILRCLSNMMTDLNLTDIETGFKVFTRDLVRKLVVEEDGFGVDYELTAKVAHMKRRIFEVGVSYAGRTYEEGKKRRFRDTLRGLRCIIKFNLGPWFRRVVMRKK